jgi:hypothetical protein
MPKGVPESRPLPFGRGGGGGAGSLFRCFGGGVGFVDGGPLSGLPAGFSSSRMVDFAVEVGIGREGAGFETADVAGSRDG